MLVGIVQAALGWANEQLDLVGKLTGQAGNGWGWALVAVLVVAGLAWEVQARRRHADSGSGGQDEPPSAGHLRIRQELVTAVRSQWIDGVLDRSLEVVARIEVDLTARSDAVEHRWGALTSLPDRTRWPAGTTLVDVYDQCRTGLLVLGAPGAGKTTALLGLAQELLCRAERDPALPVPVVFHLSSWNPTYAGLERWLVDELVKRYGLPPSLARMWVRTEAVLPLLDGLDEVDPVQRETCVVAMNTWRDSHGLLPMVVCSRTAEYEELTTRLRLPSAVMLEPLSRSMVASYLREAGRPMAGVRTVLARDDSLWELLTTPLMLSVVILAYARVPATKIRSDGDITARRDRLLADYVAAMLARPRSGLAQDRACYQPKDVRKWLSWLAGVMSRSHQTVFYPDWIQVSSLPTRWLRIRAVVQPALLVGIGTFLASLAVGEVSHLAGADLDNAFSLDNLKVLAAVGLVAALSCSQRRIAPVRAWQRSAVTRFVRSTAAGLAAGISTYFVWIWLVLPVLTVDLGWLGEFVRFSTAVLAGGIVGGLFGYAVEALVRNTSRYPPDPEWMKVSQRGGALVSMTVVATLTSAVVFNATADLIQVVFVIVLPLVLFSSALTHSRPAAELSPTAPGVAMARTRRQAIAAGIKVAVLVALVGDLVLSRLLHYHLIWMWPMSVASLQIVLIAGWLTTLRAGLSDYLRHRTVLRLLARHDCTPANLLRYLDYADSHILLRRTGGGYAFVHRLFLDHFAQAPPATDVVRTDDTRQPTG